MREGLFETTESLEISNPRKSDKSARMKGTGRGKAEWGSLVKLQFENSHTSEKAY